jgi:hypothetical protein
MPVYLRKSFCRQCWRFFKIVIILNKRLFLNVIAWHASHRIFCLTYQISPLLIIYFAITNLFSLSRLLIKTRLGFFSSSKIQFSLRQSSVKVRVLFIRWVCLHRFVSVLKALRLSILWSSFPASKLKEQCLQRCGENSHGLTVISTVVKVISFVSIYKLVCKTCESPVPHVEYNK